jgi:hypothetical protein
VCLAASADAVATDTRCVGLIAHGERKSTRVLNEVPGASVATIAARAALGTQRSCAAFKLSPLTLVLVHETRSQHMTEFDRSAMLRTSYVWRTTIISLSLGRERLA